MGCRASGIIEHQKEKKMGHETGTEICRGDIQGFCNAGA